MTDDLAAARLALFVLRASISKTVPLEADQVVLSPAAAPVSSDAAVGQLAGREKPLFCSAVARGGVLVVTCSGSQEAEPWERQMMERRRRDDEERGGAMGYLKEHYGPGDHLVAAFGRDESLVVPMSVVDRWHRDYHISGVGYSGDDVGNPLADAQPEYVGAARVGAKGVLSFRSSEDSHGKVIALSGQSPLSDQLPEAERRAVEQQLIEMARLCSESLTAYVAADKTAYQSPPPRSKWGQWQRNQATDPMRHFARTAEMMRCVFAGREMPQPVAAFVEQCEKLRS